MKRVVLVGVVFALLGFAASALGQTPPPVGLTNKIAWEQAAVSLAEAQGYTYTHYPDGATAGIPLTKASQTGTVSAVTCAGTQSPFQCEVAFPAFTPGAHTLTLTASSAGVESAQSVPLAFVFVVVPAVPANLKIK